jgi:hypothetical protein
MMLFSPAGAELQHFFMTNVYEKTLLSIKKLELYFPEMYNTRTNLLIKSRSQ